MTKLRPDLYNKLKIAGAAGASALALAITMGGVFEGTGPQKVDPETGQTLSYPYLDPVGILTVCGGVTGDFIDPKKGYTEEECHELEGPRYAKVEETAKKIIYTWPELNRWQQAGIIYFGYNKGIGALASSTMVRKFNDRDFSGGCTEFLRWVWATDQKTKIKVKLNGLVYVADVSYELCMDWKDE